MRALAPIHRPSSDRANFRFRFPAEQASGSNSRKETKSELRGASPSTPLRFMAPLTLSLLVVTHRKARARLLEGERAIERLQEAGERLPQEEKQFRFGTKAKEKSKGKKNGTKFLPMERPPPRFLSRSLSSLSPLYLTWAHTRHRKLSNCWTEAFQLGPSQSAVAPACGCAEPPPPPERDDERFFEQQSSSSPDEQ